MGISNVNKLSFEQDIKSEDYTYIMEYVLTLTFKKSSSRAWVMAVVNFTIVLLFHYWKFVSIYLAFLVLRLYSMNLYLLCDSSNLFNTVSAESFPSLFMKLSTSSWKVKHGLLIWEDQHEFGLIIYHPIHNHPFLKISSLLKKTNNSIIL